MEEMNLLQQEAEQIFDLTLTDEQVNAYTLYARELAVWNERFSLTSIRDPTEVRQKHFLDSLSCVLALRGRPLGRVVDVGTGAGFPGLPLKVLFPEMKLTLVESVEKKTRFLSHIVRELKLDGVEIVIGRAERMGQDTVHRERYDWALARAVASLPVLMEYLLPLVKLGGRALVQKGESAGQELEEAGQAIEVLGGRLEMLIPVEIPGIEEQRHLVVIEKVAPTPQKYPRREGIPAKRPIGK
jgi:16S rRNA (guanine527-N7)-methyltransferase